MSNGLTLPSETEQPFFAYGVFRPDQLGFFQIKPYVKFIRESVVIPGDLLLRDGLPILDSAGCGQVHGALLEFTSPQDGLRAYETISSLEPEKQYRWGVAEVDGGEVNVLLGRSPHKGSIICENSQWNGWEDPLFTSGLEVVAETLSSHCTFEWDLKPSFRLQMAYLLLWSAVERYLAFRYHFRSDVTLKIKQLASEPAFAAALSEHVYESRKIYRADDPTQPALILNRSNPKKAADYYYQVRSNITHRGKGAWRDHDVVLKSGSELLGIFRAVLHAAKIDAHF